MQKNSAAEMQILQQHLSCCQKISKTNRCASFALVLHPLQSGRTFRSCVFIPSVAPCLNIASPFRSSDLAGFTICTSRFCTTELSVSALRLYVLAACINPYRIPFLCVSADGQHATVNALYIRFSPSLKSTRFKILSQPLKAVILIKYNRIVDLL